MTLSVTFGTAGQPAQVFLPGTDPTLLPWSDLNGASPNATRPDALTSHPYFAEGNGSETTFDGRVKVTTSDFGTTEERSVVEITGPWNSVKNASVHGDGESVALRGFVHVDAALGLDDGGSVDLSILGAKRGNIVTGEGHDTISIKVATNAASWGNDFRIATGGGDDRVEIAPADVTLLHAMLSGTEPTGSGLVPGYDGKWTGVIADLGAGNDYFESRGEFNAHVWGGAGDDVIVLGGDARDAHAYVGQYSAFGGEGNDILKGGLGSSWLFGDEGDDVLISGGGASAYMAGGAGADRYVITPSLRDAEAKFGHGLDFSEEISGFSRAEGDVIDLSALGIRSFDQLDISQSRYAGAGEDEDIWETHVYLDGQAPLMLDGRVELSAADFIFAR